GLEDVGDHHDPLGHAQLVAVQAARVAGAIHFFVVRTGNVRYTLQIGRQRQTAQHDDGLDDVLVDLETLFGRERATPYAQVVDFSVIVGMVGHDHIEAPDIGGVVSFNRGLLFTPVNQMLGPVG